MSCRASEYTTRPRPVQTFTRTTRSPRTRSWTIRSRFATASGSPERSAVESDGSTMPCPSSWVTNSAELIASPVAALLTAQKAAAGEGGQNLPERRLCMTRLWFLGVSMVAALLALGGCGSGGNTPAASATAHGGGSVVFTGDITGTWSKAGDTSESTCGADKAEVH